MNALSQLQVTDEIQHRLSSSPDPASPAPRPYPAQG